MAQQRPYNDTSSKDQKTQGAANDTSKSMTGKTSSSADSNFGSGSSKENSDIKNRNLKDRPAEGSRDSVRGSNH